MNTTTHLSLTNLFKIIREEKPDQFAVITEDKVDDVSGKSIQVWLLSRPFKVEGKANVNG